MLKNYYFHFNKTLEFFITFLSTFFILDFFLNKHFVIQGKMSVFVFLQEFYLVLSALLRSKKAVSRNYACLIVLVRTNPAVGCL